MPAVVASITVENDELQKYFNAVEKKRGICRMVLSKRDVANKVYNPRKI